MEKVQLKAKSGKGLPRPFTNKPGQYTNEITNSPQDIDITVFLSYTSKMFSALYLSTKGFDGDRYGLF